MEKKITIKHYLNKKGKPLNPITEGRFPVYAFVIYNRKNTRINYPIHFNLYGITEDEYKALFEDESYTEYQDDIDDADELVRNVVKYEIGIYGDDFELKGLSKRIEYYHLRMIDSYEMIIKSKIYRFLEMYLTVVEHRNLSLKKWNLITLIDEIKYSYPVFIEKMSPDMNETIGSYLSFLAYEMVKGEGIAKGYVFIQWIGENLREEFKAFLEDDNFAKALASVNSLEYDITMLTEQVSLFVSSLDNSRILRNIDTFLVNAYYD